MEGWDRPVVTPKNFGEDLTSAFAAPKFSPDGQRIVYFRNGDKEKYAIWISTIAGGPPVLIGMAMPGQSWSPDGEWIAFMAGSPKGFAPVKTRSGGGGQRVMLSEPMPLGDLWSVHWSPTGEWICYGTQQGLCIVSPDGVKRRLLNKPNPMILGWSKDGQIIYGVWHQKENRHGVLSGIDLKTGNEKMILDLGMLSKLRGFSLAADGKSFLTSVEHTEDDIWILEGFQTPRRFLDFFFHN